MRHIVLTGAGGFFGRAILKECTSLEEIIVYALTTKVYEIQKEFVKYKNIKVMAFDHPKEIPWHQIDVLIHAAFPMGNDGRERAKGLDFTKEIIKIAEEYSCSVINVSTQSVYSQKRMSPATEETLVELESEYAVGKYAAELIANSVCIQSPHTNIRLGSLIGVGLEQRLVNKFIKTICEGEVIHIKGGNQVFDFMDVRDAAKAIITLSCSNSKEWADIYNVGSGKAYTLKEIAMKVIAVIKENTGIEGEYVLEEAPLWQNSSLNSDKFQSQFQVTAQYTLEDTIKAIIENNYNELMK